MTQGANSSGARPGPSSCNLCTPDKARPTDPERKQKEKVEERGGGGRGVFREVGRRGGRIVGMCRRKKMKGEEKRERETHKRSSCVCGGSGSFNHADIPLQHNSVSGERGHPVPEPGKLLLA